MLKSGCKVVVNDPKTKESFSGERYEDVWESIKKSDAIVVLTDHDEFRNLDLDRIKNEMNQNPIMLDTRRIFEKKICEQIGFDYISIGYKKLK